MPNSDPEMIRHRGRYYPVQGLIRVRGREYFLLRLLSRRMPERMSNEDPSSHRTAVEERWLALNARRGPLDDLCSLHVLPTEGLSNQRLRVLQQLARSTPFVPQILDHQFQGNQVCIITDWVPGRTLAAYFEQRNQQTRSISPYEAFRLYRGLVQTLCGLHRSTGLVHGDIHPSNIVLRSRSTWLILIDFGSAWRTLESTTNDGGDGQRAAWSAPESQVHPTADERVDQFSASVLLFQMLTGEIPYSRLGGSAIRVPVGSGQPLWQAPSKLASERHPLTSALWRQLDSFLQRTLSLKAADRFETDAAWLQATSNLFQQLNKPTPQSAGSLLDRLIRRWSPL